MRVMNVVLSFGVYLARQCLHVGAQGGVARINRKPAKETQNCRPARRTKPNAAATRSRKPAQAADRGYQGKKMPNGIVRDTACDDLCLGVVAATAKANHDALGRWSPDQ